MAARTHPFFDHDGPLPLAHQGGGGEEVENSMAAFANAAALGYRCLDVDLQATSDGVLVAHHDDSLERLTGLDVAVGNRSWAEVAELRLPNGEPLARFDDLLDAHPDARWNIEVKTNEAIDPVVELVRRRNLEQRVCLNTFSDVRMWRLRWAASALAPAYSTPIAATLWLKVTSYLPFALPALPWPTTHATQAPVRDKGVPVLDERYIRRAHRVGLTVIVWTIDEPDEMHRLLDLGVDGILTDRPSTLREVLEERAQWA
jgi:glycerophosphoryl diester phosphodiesterase